MDNLAEANLFMYFLYMEDSMPGEAKSYVEEAVSILSAIASRTNMAKDYSNLFMAEHALKIFPKTVFDSKNENSGIDFHLFHRDKFKKLVAKYPKDKDILNAYKKHKRLASFYKVIKFLFSGKKNKG